MTIHLGNIPASSTIYVPFATYDANGASVTISGFALADILIYKNGSIVQRSSTAGFTLLDTDGIDFDGITGLHGFSIDLSNNTDVGFYAAGSFYWIVVSTITVNGQTVTGLTATFRIVSAENTAGVPVTDVTRINNVATTSVTTVNANVGTTQPLNFTGTGASALVKGDAVDIAGAAVSTTSAQLGVNVVNINAVSAASVTTVSANVGTTQPINFTGTGASALVKGDTVDIAGAAVSTSTAQIGANVVNFGGSAGTFAAGRPEVNTTHAAGTAWNSGAIGAATIATDAIGAVELAADAVTEIRALASGTSDSGTTLTMVDAARTEADTDYWKGQIIVFTSGTVSGQARLITGFNAATDTITFSPATTQAVSTQTYEIRAGSQVNISATAGTDIADAILDRDMSTGTDSGSTTVRTVRQALRFLRNKWAIVGTTITVYKENDSTASWTSDLTSSSSADPITGSDPAGP